HRGPGGQRRDPAVVGVEHQRATGLDLLPHQRLDVGQLVKVVDAVHAEVVGGDVGDHGDVGPVVAQATAQDAAPRGFQHGHLDRLVVEYQFRRLRPGCVAEVDGPASHPDPVGGGHAYG